MTDAVSLPRGGLVVLNNLMAQKSAWDGWEGGHPARSPEARNTRSGAMPTKLCRARVSPPSTAGSASSTG